MSNEGNGKLVLTIRSGFQGVQLGQGVSARQTEVIDRYGEGFTAAQFDAIPRLEVTNDWSSVPSDELDRVQVAHLDAEGLRYYLPALMLSILENYDPGSMRVIGTLLALYPKKEHWNYAMERYGALTDFQKQAVATFLAALPTLVELKPDDQKVVERAMRNYWHQFLPGGGY